MSRTIAEFTCVYDPADTLTIKTVTDKILSLNSAHVEKDGDEIHINVQLDRRQCDLLAGILLGPIPMLLHCPQCGERHIDKGEFATKPHHTHACQECGHVWRPAIVATVGVKFLPGFKDATP